VLAASLIAFAAIPAVDCEAEAAVKLPQGVRAVWDMGKAWRESTPTQARYCINGLWRWQPADAAADKVPDDGWGYFKVPGCWPGITDYMQKDCQTVYANPAWKDTALAGITAAWYQREVVIPAGWAGKRVALIADTVNSFAAVYVDGHKAGDIRYPAGELDLTATCRPGTRMLSILVIAMPLNGVMLSYNDTASARQVKGSVARRGLCGDVFLAMTPTAARVTDVRTETSVRKGEISLDVGLTGLAADAKYSLRATVTDKGKPVTEFTSPIFKSADAKGDRFAFSWQWRPDKMWDLNTPQNMFDLSVSLQDAGGKALDVSLPERFGFREFWIDGRDFYLNGTRIFLSCVPIDNAQISAGLATYAGTRESLDRLKSFGINFLYTHNYGCEPGSHLGFTEMLRAADDAGVLISLSQPHFGHYEWKAADADKANGYARHAEHYVRVAGNHPSVVFYSMSHNATGYSEDMNPDLIDGRYDKRDTWSQNNAALALRAEAIVRDLDPGRIVYHHSSGNLGSMHTSNFYPNFVPIQEMSDWFEHWATEGVKPMFTCEYGAPITWDWMMYRGWYKGVRTFGSAKVPWEFCIAEWNAQFLGDHAYEISEREKANIRWEAKQFRAGSLWYRWDYPTEVGSSLLEERFPVFAAYLSDNFRAFRTWGVSATSPWEHGAFWKLREGMNRNARTDFRLDFDDIQRPGFSPDYIAERYERMDLAYERTDWVATPAAQALIRNNRPLLAYIGGKPDRFTSKDHNFIGGETVEKQVIVINSSREAVTCDGQWSVSLPTPISGTWQVTVAPGAQERMPIKFALPDNTPPGAYEMTATVKFGRVETQKDAFTINVLPKPIPVAPVGAVALYDPSGETGKLLTAMGLAFTAVGAKTDLAKFDTLIIGRGALTLDGPGPDVGRVRDGLKVIMFEQGSEVLEKRFGLRVVEYGLRQVFPRVPDHPLLTGLSPAQLHDWRGEATLTPSRLNYRISEKLNMVPVVDWCGIEVSRVWRCGNRGNVASVLIEKPARGDFMPILDGGYAQQYASLMEYREGKGMVLFCQMDVTGRTEGDPAADLLVRNILRYASTWKPTPRRTALYIGEAAGKAWLEAAGILAGTYDGGKLTRDTVLVVGPGGGRQAAKYAAAIGGWLRSGGCLMAVGLDEAEANAILPFKVKMKAAEHIAAFFEPPGAGTLLAGIAPADIHNRDPRDYALVTGGAKPVGDGVLAVADGVDVVFCQMAPWQFADYANKMNLKRTFRRTSVLVARIAGNMGVGCATPLLVRFSSPVAADGTEKRWLTGFYLDEPEDWDDPYRFFRW